MEHAKQTWFTCELDRRALKSLMRRNDWVGLARAAIWFTSVAASGTLAYLSLGTSWLVPAFFLYGTLFAFAEPLAHECSHGTAFRSRWLNETIYLLVGLMALKERTLHRWGHAHHHTHTIFVGKDPEVQLPRPISLWRFAVEVVRLRQPYMFLTATAMHAFGHISDEVKEWVPESEHRKLVSGARFYLAVYLAIFVWAAAIGSWLPILFFFLPRIYGAWLHTLLTITQHAGLAENVFDHRRNTRDVDMNPVFRFLYWNMNYHLEHHLYPLVPFHALPALHAEIKDQLPPAHDRFMTISLPGCSG